MLLAVLLCPPTRLFPPCYCRKWWKSHTYIHTMRAGCHALYCEDVGACTSRALHLLSVRALRACTLLCRPAPPVHSKRGAIINISSASGSFPCSLLSVYSSTKAYMDNMSQCLDDEYGRKGIFVQVCVRVYMCVCGFMLCTCVCVHTHSRESVRGVASSLWACTCKSICIRWALFLSLMQQMVKAPLNTPASWPFSPPR